MLLAAAVIGSGIMAQRLTEDSAVALLANTFATVAALAVLIAVLAPISGAHLNPAVSFVSYLRGQLSLGTAATYIAVQTVGCCLGAVLAHAMFELQLLQAATHPDPDQGSFSGDGRHSWSDRGGVGLYYAESGRMAVPAWIGAGVLVHCPTSFANPAITIARALSDTFAGIRPLMFPRS